MLGLIVSGLKYASAWAGIVHGSTVVAGATKKLFGEESRPAVIVAGIGDTFTTLLDPLDFTGTRKRKEDAQKAAQQSAEQKAQGAKAKAKKLEKALAVQKQKNKQAQNAIAKVNASVAKLKKEAEQLRKQGKSAAAKAKEDKARAAQRYANLANRAAIASRQAKDEKPEAGAMFASQALELAKLALSPPVNAIEALGKESTDAGRSFITSLVDAVNRPEEPNVDALFASMSQGDPDAWAAATDAAWDEGGGDDYVDGSDNPVEPDFFNVGEPIAVAGVDEDGDETESAVMVAGAGCGGSCGACSSGLACGTNLKAVPDFLIGGDPEDENVEGPDFSSWLNGIETSGADDGADFMGTMGGRPYEERESAARRYGSVDGQSIGYFSEWSDRPGIDDVA